MCPRLQSMSCMCSLGRTTAHSCMPFLSTASEDEEITVQFWNDKKVKLPRGVALWIHPSLCGRIVEMIHMPLSSRLKHRESPDTNSCIFSCSPKAAWVPVCVAHSHAKHSLLCSPCWPFLHCCGGGMCCSSACVRCFCCCRGHSDVFWPLPPKSQVFQRGAEEAELSSKSSPRLLELEGPKQGELAAVAARSLSSDSEVFPTQSTAVDSTVDTDPSCPEKPRLEESAGPSGNTPEGTTASLVPVIQVPFNTLKRKEQPEGNSQHVLCPPSFGLSTCS